MLIESDNGGYEHGRPRGDTDSADARLAVGTLFRSEVFVGRRDRLEGRVVLGQSTAINGLTALLILIVAICAIGLSVGSYARTETVRGTLVTNQPSVKIIPLAGGTVSRMPVQEGSIVKAGTLLAIVNVDRREAGGELLASGSVETIDSRLALSRAKIMLFDKKMLNERRRLEGVREIAIKKVANLEAAVALQREIVSSNKSMFDGLEQIVKNGYMSKIEYERRRQLLLSAQEQLSSLGQQLLDQQGEASAAETALRALPIEQETNENDTNSVVQNLAEQRLRASGERSYTLEAPIAGRVTAIQGTVGGFVRSDRPLMTIVPLQAEVGAELYAPSKAIGFIKRGQEVRLLYDAYPYENFGGYHGYIESISRTALEPDELVAAIKTDQPLYKIQVRLANQTIDGYGQRIALQPGMTLSANLILERETFFGWLFSPLRAAARKL